MSIEIETGIDIPSRQLPSGVSRAVQQLEVGNSFLLPLGVDRNTAHAAATRSGRRVKTRTVEVKGVPRIRVWRVD